MSHDKRYEQLVKQYKVGERFEAEGVAQYSRELDDWKPVFLSIEKMMISPDLICDLLRLYDDAVARYDKRKVEIVVQRVRRNK